MSVGLGCLSLSLSIHVCAGNRGATNSTTTKCGVFAMGCENEVFDKYDGEFDAFRSATCDSVKCQVRQRTPTQFVK